MYIQNATKGSIPYEKSKNKYNKLTCGRKFTQYMFDCVLFIYRGKGQFIKFVLTLLMITSEREARSEFSVGYGKNISMSGPARPGPARPGTTLTGRSALMPGSHCPSGDSGTSPYRDRVVTVADDARLDMAAPRA